MAKGGATTQEGSVNDAVKEGGEEGEGEEVDNDEEKSGARSVAVKIQQVPVDEVCPGVVYGAFFVGLRFLRRASFSWQTMLLCALG